SARARSHTQTTSGVLPVRRAVRLPIDTTRTGRRRARRRPRSNAALRATDATAHRNETGQRLRRSTWTASSRAEVAVMRSCRRDALDVVRLAHGIRDDALDAVVRRDLRHHPGERRLRPELDEAAHTVLEHAFDAPLPEDRARELPRERVAHLG